MYISAVSFYLTYSFRSLSLFFLRFLFHYISLSLPLSRFFSLSYYVYVQALRTRVSEAYTELDEPTFARKKLESSIVFERLYQHIPGQQQRSSLR